MTATTDSRASLGRMGAGGWLLTMAVFAYLLILIVGPVAGLAAGAFRSGILPVLEALAAPSFLTAFGLSLRISFIVVAVQLVLGTLTAWVLARHDFPGRAFLSNSIEVPFAVSPVVVGYMVLLLFGRNTLLGSLLLDLNIRVAFSVTGMTLATIFVTLPFMIRELVPVIRRLDPEKEQAASTLGASPWTTFVRVTLPSLWAAMMYGMTLTFARSLGEFGAVLVVGGGIQGRTETATLYIFRSLEERSYIEAYSAALALGLCSVVVVTAVDAWRRRQGVAPD